jgi:integrase
MRQGELLKLRWSHIDREKGFIRLPQEITKESKPKNIPMNHHVKKVLDSLPRAIHHDFVFTYKGKPIGLKIRNAFKGACERAGIPYGTKIENGLRFHDIRATFKTNLLRTGIDKAIRDTILGHSLQGMDAYYLKPSDADLKEAMDKFTSWIDAQIANVTQNVTHKAKSS